MGLPRMDAEGGADQIGLVVSQHFDGGPIRLAGGIDDAATDTSKPQGCDDGDRFTETRVLEVIVGIRPSDHGGGLANAFGLGFLRRVEGDVGD